MEKKEELLEKDGAKGVVPADVAKELEFADTAKELESADAAGGAPSAQMPAETRGEALEGASTPGADTVSALEQKSLTEPVNGLSGKKGITEEEARRLLQEETQKTQQKLLTAERKNKKFLKTVLIIAAIICIAGVVFAVVMGVMRSGGD